MIPPPEFFRFAKAGALTVVLALAPCRQAACHQITAQGQDPPWKVPRVGEQAANLDDPRRDGWMSEAFSQAAQARLKKLARFLEQGSAITAEAVSAWSSKEFQGARLRPSQSELGEAFRDETLLVQRGAPPEGRSASRNQGAKALADALRALVRAYPEDASRRLSFKLFRIAASGASYVTESYFESWISAPSETFQEVALWKCWWSWDGPRRKPLLRRIEVEDYERVSLANSAAPLFADVTEAVLGGNPSYAKQLAFGAAHWTGRVHNILGTDYFGHHGLAVGDADGDGLDDLYLCQTGGLPNRLFLSQPDGTALDASKRAGVDWLDRSRSALFLDLDQDGDQDLVVAAEQHLMFLENRGRARFKLKTTTIQVRNAYSLAAADYDSDGDLDLYACHYFPEQADDRHFPAPVPYQDARNGGRNVLLRNDGKWRWRDATREAGLEAGNHRWSFAASWEDYDNDGDPDLYVANDFGVNNLFRNDFGHFIDVAQESGLDGGAFGMSASWADYDRDGWMDLYVGNMFSAAGNRVTFQQRFKPDVPKELKSQFQRLSSGNALYRNQGGESFKDASQEAGVDMGRWAWSSPFVDLNNDGREDLVVANGYITAADERDL